MGQTSTPRRKVALSGDPFWDLIATAQKLYAPGGCPWDRAQTIDSLSPHLIEETWEAYEAAFHHDWKHFQRELGDVLYTVLLLSLILERQGKGSLRGLLRASREKMVRRHPHVFGAKSATTPAQAYRHWQAIKRQEGKRRPSHSNVLRESLVAWWDWLLKHPDAVRRLSPPGVSTLQTSARRGRQKQRPAPRRS